MRLLGLETSCDETAASVVEDGRRVLSDVVSTQIEVHKRWGGVVPELASRNHLVQIGPVMDQALSDAQLSLSDLDGIAVTSGPGLIGALLVGVQFAKGLALATGLPLIPVNHLEGHLLAIMLEERAPELPFLALVVSGGHTSLYACHEDRTYTRVGSTRDDAAGEAYDKVGKLLGLPYPGGKYIDQLAQTGNPAAIKFPRALPQHDVLDFSFSGLKTSVLHHIRAHDLPTGQGLNDLCASFQEAVADALSKKAIAACKKLHMQRLVLCGGVAANSRLRGLCASRAQDNGIAFFVPRPRLCTDNGAMIAAAGFAAHARGATADLELNASATWQL
jgi:N6-L-threonylcarbamoyladenine synthase